MWKKGQSGNPGGLKKGEVTFNESLRKAILKAAKTEKKTVGDYLWDIAKTDTRLRAKLVDKIISDAPKDLNVRGEGFVFKVITNGEPAW